MYIQLTSYQINKFFKHKQLYFDSKTKQWKSERLPLAINDIVEFNLSSDSDQEDSREDTCMSHGMIMYG